jgi:hypothetical protein
MFSLPEGLLTMNNASLRNSVALADDQTALVVPSTAQIPDNVAFSTSTYGVRTTCQSITSKCVNKSDTGPMAMLTLDCSHSTIFNYSNAGNDGYKIFFGSFNSSSGGKLNLSGAFDSYDVDSKYMSSLYQIFQNCSSTLTIL